MALFGSKLFLRARKGVKPSKSQVGSEDRGRPAFSFRGQFPAPPHSLQNLPPSVSFPSRWFRSPYARGPRWRSSRCSWRGSGRRRAKMAGEEASPRSSSRSSSAPPRSTSPRAPSWSRRTSADCRRRAPGASSPRRTAPSARTPSTGSPTTPSAPNATQAFQALSQNASRFKGPIGVATCFVIPSPSQDEGWDFWIYGSFLLTGGGHWPFTLP